jgi:hypothetical protein
MWRKPYCNAGPDHSPGAGRFIYFTRGAPRAGGALRSPAVPALPRSSLLLFGAAATVSIGGELLGAHRVGVAAAAFALVFLAAHTVRMNADPAASQTLGAGLLLLAVATASRLWRPVVAVPMPAGAGPSAWSWVVPSLDGERLTEMLLLLAGTALALAVYQLPDRRRPSWPAIAAVGLALVPLAVAANALTETVVGIRWPLPADPWPMLAVVLPGLLAAALAGTSAAVGAQRARNRLALTTGALAFQVAIVADVLRAADQWSLATTVSTLPGNSSFLMLGARIWVKEPTLVDRLLNPHPGAALLAALALVGPALLAQGAGPAGITKPLAGPP